MNPITITIELDEETAAALWSDNWGEKNPHAVRTDLRHIITGLCKQQASNYRQAFPLSITRSITDFRNALALDTGKPSFQAAAQPAESKPFTAIFTNRGGMPNERVAAAARLTLGKEYTICGGEIHGSITHIRLKEDPGRDWNTSLFDLDFDALSAALIRKGMHQYHELP